MQCFELPIDGLKLLIPKIYSDSRGFFLETYQKDRLKSLGIDLDFVQDNCSFSHQNVLRGLHFQLGAAQDKLVSCSFGKVFDVAVDLRKGSKTYLQWHAQVLDDQKQQMFFIPKGFAHGFCVLSEKAQVRYKVSAFYDPESEKTLLWNDPNIGIDWPVSEPILSEKDQKGLLVKELEVALDCR